MFELRSIQGGVESIPSGFRRIQIEDSRLDVRQSASLPACLFVCLSALLPGRTISGLNLAHAQCGGREFHDVDRSHGGASVACQTWPTSSSYRSARRARPSNSVRSTRQHACDNDLRATLIQCTSSGRRRRTPPALQSAAG